MGFSEKVKKGKFGPALPLYKMLLYFFIVTINCNLQARKKKNNRAKSELDSVV